MLTNHNRPPRSYYSATIISALFLTACGNLSVEAPIASGGASSEATASTSAGPQNPDAECHYRGLLPDPVCSPGLANPEVTQDNIDETICIPGWTDSIRPDTSYTNPLKAEIMQAYGIPVEQISEYRLDHIVPLSGGGHPTDPRNFYPQPEEDSYDKDYVEREINDAICEEPPLISLNEAVRRMATDWTTALDGIA
jgi:hypothetical protein